ncbi:MAG: hypothetical protein PWQ82_144 [Thermosediminibacterales bacterium]|nr:hypothetical protein [Thermosediminibacterales bacterium]MDK2835309.1 hypothetical protein [Thermosediminibacterales bacterium]
MSKMINRLLNKHTKKILDIIQEGIIVTDENAIVKYINPAYCDFAGIKHVDIIGKYLPDVRPGARLPEALKKGKPFFDVPRKVGSVESYVDLLPIKYNNKVVGGIVVVKDVLMIKKLSKQLEESKEKLTQLNQRVKDIYNADFCFKDIIGAETGLKSVTEIAYKAAHTDSPVLLLGESGTGKEVFAQAIHNESNRKNGPFVDVNCAAIPESLLESEMFGYSKGAFTGANKSGKIGLFELAKGGTIFLDEIAELPFNLQSKLLRVLQGKKMRRIGDNKPIDLDVRVIAATNKDIESLVNEGKFREDLFFRLAVFLIKIPPLRERRSDIPYLVDYFIEEHENKHKHSFLIEEETMSFLKEYDWPGNVRELKNVLEFACNVTEDFKIKLEDLPRNLIKFGKYKNVIEKNSNNSLQSMIENFEKQIIEGYLKKYGNNLEAKHRISQELNISIATLYNKIRKYNL